MGATDDPAELSLDQLVELERRAEEAEVVKQNEADAANHSLDDASDDDGVVVLPWWQHPVNIVTLVVTAAILAGMVGWLIGSSDGDSHNEVDTGFLQDMRVHHEQGVAMASTYLTRPDISPGLAIVAASIIQGQTLEVGRMIQLLRDFNEAEAPDLQGTAMTWMNMDTTYDAMPGMATDEQLAELAASSGREADELFVELMTTHHQGGVHMAQFAAENGKSDEVKAFAEGVIVGQQGEIAELQGQLG